MGIKHQWLISIITPCLNRAEFISEAIDSVQNQDYSNVEHIVIDGGSTDGTLDILKQYEHLQVISEYDSGLYDAINKGIKLSSGEIIGFLNTDDYYEPNIFGLIVQSFSEHPDACAVVGGADTFIDHPIFGRKIKEKYSTIPEDNLLYCSTLGAPIFNAWFFHKSLFQSIGVFNTKYKLVADRDFLIRMHNAATRFFSLSNIFYHYRIHEGSLTFTNQEMGESELTSELLSLCEHNLNRFEEDPIFLQINTAWHSHLTADQVVGALKKNSPKRAFKYFRCGIQYDRFWPFRFLSRVIYRLQSNISKRIQGIGEVFW